MQRQQLTIKREQTKLMFQQRQHQDILGIISTQVLWLRSIFTLVTNLKSGGAQKMMDVECCEPALVSLPTYGQTNPVYWVFKG